MTFAAHFRQLAIPRVMPWVCMEAECVRRGVDSFSEAYDVIYREARRLGALHLPPSILEELEDWIATTLLTEIERAERASAQ